VHENFQENLFNLSYVRKALYLATHISTYGPWTKFSYYWVFVFSFFTFGSC